MRIHRLMNLTYFEDPYPSLQTEINDFIRLSRVNILQNSVSSSETLRSVKLKQNRHFFSRLDSFEKHPQPEMPAVHSCVYWRLPIFRRAPVNRCQHASILINMLLGSYSARAAKVALIV